MNEIYLESIFHELHPQEAVYKWDCIELNNGESRLYYKPNTDVGNGFDFFAVEKDGHVLNDETLTNEWHEKYCIVECIIHGIAYFDGVRHLYYGDKQTDNYGYHYYPNLSLISEAVLSLGQLEKTYCSRK